MGDRGMKDDSGTFKGRQVLVQSKHSRRVKPRIYSEPWQRSIGL